METSTHTNIKTAQSTGNIFGVRLFKTKPTIGTVDWIKEEGIFASFDAKEFTLSDASVVNCRYAEIQIGTKTQIVAVENLCLIETIRRWEMRLGVQHVAIDWEGRFEPFFPFDISFTPGGRQFVEDIASRVREEFGTWVLSDKQTETLEVKFIPAVFRRYSDSQAA